jgi:hypothetical protein
MANVGIKQAWSLLEFAKLNGKMQIGQFADKETGEVFKSCIFTKDTGARCFVSFSSNLGELTSTQIVAQKEDLRVVELNSGIFKLCKNNNSWEDVDL